MSASTISSMPAAARYSPVSGTSEKSRTSERIPSLDVVRGVVMLLMAIDHVRVYSGLPAGGPTPGIFFTRWITHFVAPAFAFLAGTGAFFLGRKLADTRALSRYLISRGFVLVLMELTVLRVAWTFNFDFAHYILAGVIWMLGWCMVAMGGLVRFSSKQLAAFGLIVIFAQDAISLSVSAMSEPATHAIGLLLQLLYFGGVFQLGHGGPAVAVLFVIVPWVGVMAVGYAFGEIMLLDDAGRRRICLTIGLSATVIFAVVATILALRTPAGPHAPRVLFRILGQRKYPASQLFLLMTLGPMIALIPLAERATGAIGRVLATYGRVPMFYYLLHIPTIHFAAVIVSKIRDGQVNPWLFANHPMMPPPPPPGYTWSLSLLYFVYAIVVIALYFPCQWYARAKSENPRAWMRFV